MTRKSSPYLDGLETPVYTTYTYHPQDGYVTKVTNPDGSYSVPTYTGFNEKMESYAEDGSLLSTVNLIKNAKGQVLTRTVDGKSLNYEYAVAGRLTTILDPENGATTTVYDNAGRKTSVTDLNSGTTSYTYDQVGNIETQKDERNITTTFTYDKLNRPTSVTVEASYTIGEYDIQILSAKFSGGLEIWLNQNGYKIPKGAREALKPYIKQKLKFFVAKVNLKSLSQGLTFLRPLQFAYESPKFMNHPLKSRHRI